MRKGLIVFILIILALFSVSGVCAGDVNDDTVTSQDSATMELTQIDEDEISSADESQVVGQTDNREIMRANEKGTFTDLRNEIQNGYNSNITLGRDYEYDGSGVYGIKITQSITIDGNGSTIDAKRESVIFDISGDNVVIKNITFKNAYIPNYPYGAIRLDGVNFTISDCVFTGNSAYRFGGAIFASDSICTISDCVFVRNTVSYGSGGAIFAQGCNCIICGCVFEDNSAQSGGAIYGGRSNIISDCVFVNNHASGGNGGAIRCEGSSVGCNISGCYFADNRGNNGIISLSYGQDKIINGNIFLNNNGDAIYFQNQASSANTDYNWFGHNSTNYGDNPNVGGCNVWLFLDATTTNNVSVSGEFNVTFKLYAYNSTNVSEYDNGRLKAVNLTLALTNGEVNTTNVNIGKTVQCTVESGKIGKLTATIKNAADTISLVATDGTTFFDLNTTINGNNNDIIVLDRDYTYNSTADSDFTDGIVINRPLTIIGNGHALDAAGQVRIFDIESADVTIKNITFINAEKNASGAAILWKGANGIVSGCSFVNNSAISGGGGAILWWGYNGIVSGCSFVNNSAISGGGAIYWAANRGVVSGCSFVNNSAEEGGAIWWKYYNGNISACIFVNNSAADGIIYFNNQQSGQNLTINDNIFLNNDGVAIYFVKSDPTSNADNNWFGNNATNYDMAPITTNIEINTWLFLNATANPDEISIFDSSDIVFKLYAYNSSGVSEYDNSRLKRVNLTLTSTNGRVNTTRVDLGETVHYTPDGAGIGEITATIENVVYTIPVIISDGTTFWDLNNTINGNNNDTIILDRDYAYNSTTDFNFKDGVVISRPVTIIGNGHTLNGAGQAKIFYVESGNVTIKNVTFINGQSAYGGAIEWHNGEYGRVYDCIFMDNNAITYGGAIYWYNSFYGVVSGCVFTNNHIFDVNQDVRYGGAIMSYNSNYGSLLDCVFVNNSCEGEGIIYWTSDYANVSGCYFANNSAGMGIFFVLFSENVTINNNIFLNNNETAIFFYRNDSTCNADYNWFGNTASDYNKRPVTQNIELNTWLFLNATAVPDSIDIFKTCLVTFDLYAYNPSGGVSNYDPALLAPVNLTVNAENGDVDKDVVRLGEAIEYTATSCGGNRVTATVEDIAQAIEVDVSKLDPMISVESLEVPYSENTIITLHYNSTATGKVSITLTGKKFNKTIILDIDEAISLGAVLPDEYNVTVFYSGDGIFSDATANATLKVNKLETSIACEPAITVWGNEDYLIVNLTDENNKAISGVNLTVELNGAENYITDENGTIKVPLKGLSAGNYTVEITFNEDTLFLKSNATAEVTVNKANSTFTVDNVVLDYGSGANVTVTAEGAIGITAEIDGITVGVIGFDVPISGLDAGTHTLTVTTIPDENHISVNRTAEIVVNKLATEITATNKAYVINYGGKYGVTLKDAKGNVLSGKNVTFTFNGKNIGSATTDANGVATISLTAKILKAAKAGKRELVVKFAGDVNYNASSKTVKITVNKEKTKIAAKKKTFKRAKKVKKYTITLKNSKGKVVKKVKVTLKIKGKTFKAKTNSKGKATFKIKKITKKGTFKSTIKFKGNAYYKKVTKKVKIKLK